IEGVAGDEMLQPLDRLRRADQPAGTAAYRIATARLRVDVAHGMAAAGRAFVGKFVRLRILRPLVEIDGDHLRDHVAGALYGHGVADADVVAAADRLAVAAEPGDIVLVVQ